MRVVYLLDSETTIQKKEKMIGPSGPFYFYFSRTKHAPLWKEMIATMVNFELSTLKFVFDYYNDRCLYYSEMFVKHAAKGDLSESERCRELACGYFDKQCKIANIILQAAS